MRVVCRHCGLPVTVAVAVPDRPVYCCSGCAWADRLLVGSTGRPPGDAALVASGAAAVFGGVNQGLLWLLSGLLEREGVARGAELALLGAHGAGVIAALALTGAQWRAGARRAFDLALAMGAIIAQPAGWLAAATPGWGWAANLVLAAWALRGLIRPRQKSLGVDG